MLDQITNHPAKADSLLDQSIKNPIPDETILDQKTTSDPVGADVSHPSPMYQPVGADVSHPSPMYQPIGADVSHPSPMYPSVGADVSCPSPIYRPVGASAELPVVVDQDPHAGILANPSRPPTYRPDTPDEHTHYVVRLPAFEGPLDLLLYLIEKQQMEITTISLVAVTDQYLAYLQHWQDSERTTASPALYSPPLANMAAFISIATRLLFIKSQSLLSTGMMNHAPTEAPGQEIEDAATLAEELRHHLLEYQAAKEIARHLRQREEAGLQTYERSGLLANTRFLRPGQQTGQHKIEAHLAWSPRRGVMNHAPTEEVQSLAQAFQQVLQRRAKEEHHNALLLPLARVRVRDLIAAIVTRLHTRPRISLAELIENEPSRLVIIVTFLAILDMWKQERIAVHQETLFGPMYLERGVRWAETEEVINGAKEDDEFVDIWR